MQNSSSSSSYNSFILLHPVPLIPYPPILPPSLPPILLITLPPFLLITFPPSSSPSISHLNTDVIILFLYGICVLPLTAFSYNATITISKKNNDVFMYFASVNIEPEELVFPTLSLPAKSTKCNLDRLIISDPKTV